MKISTGLAGEMSGSIGGITASHNRGGAYLRRRAIPTNPATARQDDVRSGFASAVNAWTNVLTEQQREEWRVFAANTPTVDTLGNPLVLTGQQAYIKANQIRLQISGTLQNNAPEDFNNGPSPVFAVSNPFFDLTDDTLTVGGTIPGTAPAGGVLVLYIGKSQNPSRTFYKGPYQLAWQNPFSAAASTWTVEVDITDPEYTSDYPIIVGNKTPMRVVLVYNDGRVSTPLSALLPVQEGA